MAILGSSVLAKSPLLRWTAAGTWMGWIEEFVSAALPPHVIDHILAIDTTGYYDDDIGWFDLVTSEASAREEDLLNLADAYIEQARVHAFHGTRTADARTFLIEGIRLHSRSQLEAEIRAKLLAEPELAWVERNLDAALARTAHLLDEGKCFVVVDERVLVEECGHYLLGGSEFIQGIIGPLELRPYFGAATPTVIEVALPLSRVSPSLLREFSRALIGEWCKLRHRPSAEPRRIDFTFSLTEPVRSDWIIGHFHPPFVHDPHGLRKPIRTELLSMRVNTRGGQMVWRIAHAARVCLPNQAK